MKPLLRKRNFMVSSRLFSRVLVAVDGSPASLHALAETFRLARAEHTSVAVVSVVPPYDGDLRLVGVRNIHALMRAPAEHALSDAMKVAGDQGFPVEPVLEQGEPHESIVTLAEKQRCDLIVVGVRGHNVSETALMGSVTARVIGFGTTDVLVIPQHSALDWQRIVLAVDGSQWSRSAAHRAFQFVESYGARLTVVSVADVPSHLYGLSPGAAEEMISESREYLAETRQEAETRDIHAQYVVHEGNPAEKLIEVVSSLKADLLIVGSHGRTGLKRLLMGSVTERVVQYSPCPVLVVRSTV